MTKLCPRGKAAAKRKFKVYPSAYANAYASKICAGKIKDPSGVKRKDFKGPKPAAEGAMINKPKKLMGGGPAGFLSIFKKKDKPKQVKDENNKPAKKKKKRLEELKKEIENLNMGGVAKTAGAQSAMGRLEKSGMKLANGGDTKIKKVIKGLNKASALHKGQAKTLGTLVNKKAVGGMADFNKKAVGDMADYYKDLM